MKINLTVKGMYCNSCNILVREALEEIGASNIIIKLDEKKQIGEVSFECKDKKKAIEVIEKEGYKVNEQ